MAATVWLLYMAFEPYVRRKSPGMLISWSRLLGGRLRDPLLGKDLLVGVALGVAAVFISALARLAAPLAETNLPPILATQLTASPARSLGIWLDMAMASAGGGLSFVFVWVLLRLVLRRWWLAAIGLVLVNLATLGPGPGPAFALRAAASAVVTLLMVYAVTRFGVVTISAFTFVWTLLDHFPLTADLSAWYAPTALIVMLSVLAIAVYGFHSTLAGRPLWREEP